MTIGFPPSRRPAIPAPWPRRREGPVFARQGMIAAEHPLIVATGLGILRDGGNAVDAAVGAALVAGVVLPQMCGLGGDLFGIVSAPGRTPGPVAVLGSGIAPRGASIETMRRDGEAGGTRKP